jgi:hypothetical protein
MKYIPQHCNSCLYWQGQSDGKDGLCRRHAPPVRQEQFAEGNPARDYIALWSVVLADDWCGEYTPRDADKRQAMRIDLP